MAVLAAVPLTGNEMNIIVRCNGLNLFRSLFCACVSACSKLRYGINSTRFYFSDVNLVIISRSVSSFL